MLTGRNLFVATALLEIGSGLVTLFLPATAIALLLGAEHPSVSALYTARLYGVALLAIGIVCWCARNGAPSAATRAVLCGMLTYNVGACSVLAAGSILAGLSGILLWPAAMLHAALTLWCVAILRAAQPA